MKTTTKPIYETQWYAIVGETGKAIVHVPHFRDDEEAEHVAAVLTADITGPIVSIKPVSPQEALVYCCLPGWTTIDEEPVFN